MKPPDTEMYPSRYHTSTGAPSSALRLGFSDVPKDGQTSLGQDATPSKVKSIPGSEFTFQVSRAVTESGSNDGVQQMWNQIRDQAAKIKAEIAARRDAQDGANVTDRTFAKPKGRVGRFSAAHMAEFKKMDSIQGHASAWRAQEGRFSPVKSLKRTPSKAKLDASAATFEDDSPRQPFGGTIAGQPANMKPRSGLKRKSSAANLDHDTNQQLAKTREGDVTPEMESKDQPTSTAKRSKQRQEDDVASSKPGSRAMSVFARLASPKKTPVPRSTPSSRAATKPTVSLVGSPTKSTLNKLPKSALFTNSDSATTEGARLRRRIISPQSFNKMKSILRGNKDAVQDGMSAIPAPQATQTPGASRLAKELPPVPLTTPRRKLTKRVMFTPDVVTAAKSQNSPSPQRTGNIKLRPALKALETQDSAVDEDFADSTAAPSLYPDLSPLRHLIDSRPRQATPLSVLMPGTFTFRSDHTIKFGRVSPSGFGSSAGQSSVRQVGLPTASGSMPGGFPAPEAPSSHPDKENKPPNSIKIFRGTAHGMQNKKRHRAESDSDDFDDSRAAKKRKNESVPEGQELLAPRLVKPAVTGATKSDRSGRTSVKTASSRSPWASPGRALSKKPHATPAKKTPGLSMSRLNMLAKPKRRA